MALFVDRDGRTNNPREAIDWVGVWLLVSTWCTLSGWLLSALGALNRQGYAVSLALFLLVLWLGRKPLGLSGRKIFSLRLRRFWSRRRLPQGWLLLAVLIFLGGLTHHPNNYDYLSYRFTRVLHWAWEQHWHWIYTRNHRMDITTPGFEWIMTPLFIFFKTDRLFFLVNFISFLLMPGLIFSVFSRMGISRRICWWWMWVLPCGFCYALQGGSASNDLFGAIYVLAAFHYLLKTGEIDGTLSRNFAYSCLAIGLATGAKISNVPLGLPWLVALFLQRQHWLKIRPVVLMGTACLAMYVSFLPTVLFNIAHTGSYTGDPKNEAQMQLSSPIAGLVGNSILILINNFRPPLWPSQIPLTDSVPEPLKSYLAEGFPRFEIAIDQIQMEESAGLGIAIMASLLMFVALRCWAGQAHPALILRANHKAVLIFIGTCTSLVLMLGKLGNEGAARLITPYYLLLIAGILALLALDGTVVRFFICKVLASVALGITLFLVVISPARPLFPTDWATALMSRISPSRVERVHRVYSVYTSRYDAMKDLRDLLPLDEKIVGLVQSGDSVEATLWRPYGLRQIVDVLPEQSLDQLKAEHLHLIIVENASLKNKFNTNMADLMKKWSATIFVQHKMMVRATQGEETWYIIALP